MKSVLESVGRLVAKQIEKKKTPEVLKTPHLNYFNLEIYRFWSIAKGAY